MCLTLSLSGTTAPKPRLLGLLTALMFTIGTVVFFFIEGDDVDFAEAAWWVNPNRTVAHREPQPQPHCSALLTPTPTAL